jgi:iron-sulfur cluster repair protein YtfE (RIC family)
MENPTQPLRSEHQQLLVHVDQLREAAREVPRLALEEREAVVARILEFLRGTLIPHAEAEEGFLYPEVARLLGHEEATAPMSHDHVAIGALTDALAEADPSETDALQELLYGLHALITVHFRKEEDIYLPLLDAQQPDAVQELLGRMSASSRS